MGIERLLRYPPERRSQVSSARAARVRSNPYRLSKLYTAELTWPFIREVATLWGLAAYGEAGAKRVLELLQTELALAMGLSGRANLAAIDRSLVKVHAPPVTWPPATEQ